MAKRFYLRDTNLASPLHVSNSYEKEMNLDVQSGGGTGLISPGVDQGGFSDPWLFTSPANEPGQATWDNPSASTPYSISLDISAAGANMLLDAKHVRRAASDLSSETSSANFCDSFVFSGTGIKTDNDMSGTAPASIGGDTDRICMWITCRNTNSMHSTETITLDVDSADSWFEGPWTAAPPPEANPYPYIGAGYYPTEG